MLLVEHLEYINTIDKLVMQRGNVDFVTTGSNFEFTFVKHFSNNKKNPRSGNEQRKCLLSDKQSSN